MYWSKRPTDFINVVEADLRKRRNDIAAEVLRSVVVSSPVDTGAYRGNHRVSINSADYSFEISQTDKRGQRTISAGMAVIDSANQPFQAIYVQTNLPYAEVLEDGHSQQAPNGVYRPAFAHIRAKYSKS